MVRWSRMVFGLLLVGGGPGAAQAVVSATGSCTVSPPERLRTQDATIGARMAVTRTADAVCAAADGTNGRKRGSAAATAVGTATALPAVVPAAKPIPLFGPR